MKYLIAAHFAFDWAVRLDNGRRVIVIVDVVVVLNGFTQYGGGGCAVTTAFLHESVPAFNCLRINSLHYDNTDHIHTFIPPSIHQSIINQSINIYIYIYTSACVNIFKCLTMIVPLLVTEASNGRNKSFQISISRAWSALCLLGRNFFFALRFCFCLFCCRSIGTWTWTNQSVNQSISQSTNQSIKGEKKKKRRNEDKKKKEKNGHGLTLIWEDWGFQLLWALPVLPL